MGSGKERNRPCFCGSGRKQKNCHIDINVIYKNSKDNFIIKKKDLKAERVSSGSLLKITPQNGNLVFEGGQDFLGRGIEKAVAGAIDMLSITTMKPHKPFFEKLLFCKSKKEEEKMVKQIALTREDLFTFNTKLEYTRSIDISYELIKLEFNIENNYSAATSEESFQKRVSNFFNQRLIRMCHIYYDKKK